MPRRTEAEIAYQRTVAELATRAQADAMAGGREVVQQSAPLWRRVTDGDPCGWCAMLASRGPVYGSEADAVSVTGRGKRVVPQQTRGRRAGGIKARGDRKIGSEYHGHCGCTAEPFEGTWDEWEPTPLESYFDEAYGAVHVPGMTGERTAALMDEWMKANPYRAAAEAAPGRSESVARMLAALDGRGETFGFDAAGLDARAVDETADTLAALLERFPGVNIDVHMVGDEVFADTLRSAVAFHRSTAEGKHALYFRASRHADYDAALAALQRQLARGATQTVEREGVPYATTAAHEFGHALEYEHAIQLGGKLSAQYGYKKTGITFLAHCMDDGATTYKQAQGRLRRQVPSDYGAENYSEVFAETFAELYSNGWKPSPRKFSKWLAAKLLELES